MEAELYPRITLDEIREGDHVHYRTETSRGEKGRGYPRFRDSVIEVVRGRGGAVIGVKVGRGKRLVPRERIVEAWRSNLFSEDSAR